MDEIYILIQRFYEQLPLGGGVLGSHTTTVMASTPSSSEARISMYAFPSVSTLTLLPVQELPCFSPEIMSQQVPAGRPVCNTWQPSGCQLFKGFVCLKGFTYHLRYYLGKNCDLICSVVCKKLYTFCHISLIICKLPYDSFSVINFTPLLLLHAVTFHQINPCGLWSSGL